MIPELIFPTDTIQAETYHTGTWLLNVNTFFLERFDDDRATIGKYAILSHRWQADEVLFEDVPTARFAAKAPQEASAMLWQARKSPDFAKVEGAAAQAKGDGYEYVWIDTCCINKESSAELSEAINSMYRWYGNAGVCYAYLADVDLKTPPQKTDKIDFKQFGMMVNAARHAGTDIESRAIHFHLLLYRSEWFKRGWTLQELISPCSVHFFDKYWQVIGTKEVTCQPMVAALSAISSIPRDVLQDPALANTYCIAARMSWAAHRRTTRSEDQAYCMLGIFGVNMPLLYGEGNHAFERLQQEIMRITTDRSILAWHVSPTDITVRCINLHSDGIGAWSDPTDEPSELTNNGLRIKLPVIDKGGYLEALLDYKSESYRRSTLRLHKSPAPAYDGYFSGTVASSRIPCQVDRDWSRASKTTGSPRWTDLIIARHGYVQTVTVELLEEEIWHPSSHRLYSGRRSTAQIISRIVLGDEKGPVRISYGHFRIGSSSDAITRSSWPGGPDLYLYGAQFLRQQDSFSTFEMRWSTEELVEQDLLFTLPCTEASIVPPHAPHAGELQARAQMVDAETTTSASAKLKQIFLAKRDTKQLKWNITLGWTFHGMKAEDTL